MYNFADTYRYCRICNRNFWHWSLCFNRSPNLYLGRNSKQRIHFGTKVFPLEQKVRGDTPFFLGNQVYISPSYAFALAGESAEYQIP